MDVVVAPGHSDSRPLAAISTPRLHLSSENQSHMRFRGAPHNPSQIESATCTKGMRRTVRAHLQFTELRRSYFMIEASGWFAITLSFYLSLAFPCQAQSFPSIELTPVFPALNCKFPVRIEEAPDGSHRSFVVEQDGRILMAHQGTDGRDAEEFLNITNRQPHASYEQGLLSLAFHPGCKTNGLLYIYYNQQAPRRSVISEFKISATNANRADLRSELRLVHARRGSSVQTWAAGRPVCGANHRISP
jgi:Glucose / Sorbosone dehydrogenase